MSICESSKHLKSYKLVTPSFIFLYDNSDINDSIPLMVQENYAIMWCSLILSAGLSSLSTVDYEYTYHEPMP